LIAANSVAIAGDVSEEEEVVVVVVETSVINAEAVAIGLAIVPAQGAVEETMTVVDVVVLAFVTNVVSVDTLQRTVTIMEVIVRVAVAVAAAVAAAAVVVAGGAEAGAVAPEGARAHVGVAAHANRARAHAEAAAARASRAEALAETAAAHARSAAAVVVVAETRNPAHLLPTRAVLPPTDLLTTHPHQQRNRLSYLYRGRQK